MSEHPVDARLVGFDCPLGQYPGPAVPVCSAQGSLYAVYSTENQPEFVPLSNNTPYTSLSADQSGALNLFDPMVHRLFAHGSQTVVMYVAADERRFFEELLTSPDFSKHDPFIRLSLTKTLDEPGALQVEVARCLRFFKDMPSKLVNSWYSAMLKQFSTTVRKIGDLLPPELPESQDSISLDLTLAGMARRARRTLVVVGPIRSRLSEIREFETLSSYFNVYKIQFQGSRWIVYEALLFIVVALLIATSIMGIISHKTAAAIALVLACLWLLFRATRSRRVDEHVKGFVAAVERLQSEGYWQPHVMAFGVGTAVVGKALLRFLTIEVDRVVLIDSVLPQKFPWQQIKRSAPDSFDRVLNVVTERQPILRRLLLGNGLSGIRGFVGKQVRNYTWGTPQEGEDDELSVLHNVRIGDMKLFTAGIVVSFLWDIRGAEYQSFTELCCRVADEPESRRLGRIRELGQTSWGWTGDQTIEDSIAMHLKYLSGGVPSQALVEQALYLLCRSVAGARLERPGVVPAVVPHPAYLIKNVAMATISETGE
jgi:hypothetical protein